MIRLLVMAFAILLAVLGWQSWRLSDARQKIDSQQAAIQDQGKKLTQKNSQLIALNILTQTSSRVQTNLYAAAENNNALLRQRQQKIEELKRENQELRRWADSLLPDAVIRLRTRPALAGGESYREWLSQNHPVPPGSVSPTK